jgi:ParB family chromosome partitioning protein
MRVLEIPLAEITVKRRIRKRLGDLGSLVNSLKRYGQLSPVIVNRDYVLISGQRRLEAARKLGWSTIKAVVLDRDTPLEMLELEMEENVERRNFTPEELSNGFDSIERLRHPGALRGFFRWLWAALKKLFAKRRRLP